jgi:YkoY family integral membrane protein
MACYLQCRFAATAAGQKLMLDRLLDLSTNFGVDTLLLLPVLIALEAVLSADNAIALAAIAQGLDGETEQRRALNFGLLIAFVLRVALILTAGWVLQFWQFEVLGAAYLLWLVYKHFTAETDSEEHHHGPRFASLWQAIPVIAFTDLAFSLDSVTTAIALSQEVLVILLGGTIGIITLRFMAGLFIRWLEEYERLEDAGFITVAFVGIRLLTRVMNPELVPPDWVMVTLIGVIFVWGFSKRVEPETVSVPDEGQELHHDHSKVPSVMELEHGMDEGLEKGVPPSTQTSDVEYAEPS